VKGERDLAELYEKKQINERREEKKAEVFNFQ
jgi:hypothetical protein